MPEMGIHHIKDEANEILMMSDDAFSHAELVFEVLLRLITKVDLDAKVTTSNAGSMYTTLVGCCRCFRK